MKTIIQFFFDHWQVITGVGSAVGLGLNFILKRFITESRIAAYETKMKAWGEGIQTFGFGIGKVVTGGLSHWKYSKPFWNNLIEPYVIVFLRLMIRVLIAWLRKLINGLILGLQSDNPSFKKE